MSKERYCVTGCFGAVGSTICRKLLDEGKFVFGIDKISSTIFASQNRFTSICNDLSDYLLLFNEFSKNEISVIIHTAANIDTSCFAWNREELMKDNFRATSTLLSAAHSSEVKVFVFTSTHNIDFEIRQQLCHTTNYTMSKFLAEREVCKYASYGGMSTVSLRAGVIYGENDRYFPKLIKASQLGARFCTADDIYWDCISLEELADMHIHAAKTLLSTNPGYSSGRVYHVGYKRKALSDWNQLLVKKNMNPMNIVVPWFFWFLIGLFCELCEFVTGIVGGSIRKNWFYWTIADAKKMYTTHFYSNEKFLHDFQWDANKYKFN